MCRILSTQAARSFWGLSWHRYSILRSEKNDTCLIYIFATEKKKRNEKDVDKRNVSCFPTKVQPHSVAIIIYGMAAQSRQKVLLKDTDIGLHVFQRKKSSEACTSLST